MTRIDNIKKLISEYSKLSPLWCKKMFDSIDYSDQLSEQEQSVITFLKKAKRVENLFRKIVLGYDAYAKSFISISNYLDYEFNYLHPIPEIKIHGFINNIEKFRNMVIDTQCYKDEIKRINKRKDNINSFLVTPSRIPIDARIKTIDVQNIIENIKKIDRRMNKYQRRIKIKYSNKNYSARAIPNKTTRTVEIILIKHKSYAYYDNLSLVHELGHAMDMIEMMDKGVDPVRSAPYYKAEKRADDLRYKYIMKYYTQDDREKYMFNLLNDIVITLFQFDIFNNPKQDFAKAFGIAVSTVYPNVHQENNPLYIFKCEWAVNQPLLSTIHVINLMDSFIKENKIK